MSKFKIVNLIDRIFISCSTFLIIYAWINFYLRDLWTTFILSLIFSNAVLFVFYYFLNKKKNKQLSSLKEIENINTQFLIFKLNPLNKKLALLKEILSKEYNVIIKNKTISYTKENKKYLIILATNLDVIDNAKLVNLLDEFNKEDVDIIEIVCNETANNLNTNLFTNTQIKFITKKILYLDFFLKYNIFPDNTNINTKCIKLKFVDIVKNMFTPNKAKSYFFCGFILILSSIILPYHFYYIIVGSSLLLFSIICKVLPKIKDY